MGHGEKPPTRPGQSTSIGAAGDSIMWHDECSAAVTGSAQVIAIRFRRAIYYVFTNK